mgnify:CR=1 FL=1
MSREWKVLMKKSAGVIEKCLRRIFIYANNEPKSALARELGDCRDNKGNIVFFRSTSVSSAYSSFRQRALHWRS